MSKITEILEVAAKYSSVPFNSFLTVHYSIQFPQSLLSVILYAASHRDILSTPVDEFVFSHL